MRVAASLFIVYIHGDNQLFHRIDHELLVIVGVHETASQVRALVIRLLQILEPSAHILAHTRRRSTNQLVLLPDFSTDGLLVIVDHVLHHVKCRVIEYLDHAILVVGGSDIDESEMFHVSRLPVVFYYVLVEDVGLVFEPDS